MGLKIDITLAFRFENRNELVYFDFTPKILLLLNQLFEC